jgi:hypothetical protein
MQDRRAPVDLALQDIQSGPCPYGGIALVYRGDFKQILPVVVKGGREHVVRACFQQSHLWQHVKTLNLTQNM